MQDLNFSYVQMSRHQKQLDLFVDQEVAGENFERVIARMEKPRENLLANDIWAQELQEHAAAREQCEPERVPRPEYEEDFSLEIPR